MLRHPNLPSIILQVLLITLLFCLPTSSYAQDSDSDTASAEYTNSRTFQNAILNSTNTYRSQHNATALRWNASLASFAQDWSDACVFVHSGGPSGENLASGYPNATASIEAWGNERDMYDFAAGEFGEATGHFTQLVWKDTKTVGCSRTECDGRDNGGAPGWYVVCEYYPPGNVIGEFQQNVQPQVSGDDGGNDGLPPGYNGDANSIKPTSAVWGVFIASILVAGGMF